MCASLISHSLLLLISFLIKINLTCLPLAHKGSQPYNKDLPHGSLWTAHLVHLWIIQDWTLLKKTGSALSAKKMAICCSQWNGSSVGSNKVVNCWWCTAEAKQLILSISQSHKRLQFSRKHMAIEKGAYTGVFFDWFKKSFLCVGAQTRLVPPNRW